MQVCEDTSLITFATTRIAPVRSPDAHVIRWNPELVPEEFVDHIYLHEIAHITRAWPEIEKGTYKVPGANRDQIKRAIEILDADFDAAESPYPFPAHIRRKFIETLQQGLITQLTSQPVDMRIESAIHEEYPEHRDTQREFLLSEKDRAYEIVSREKRRRLPPKLTEWNIAMNHAYGEALSRATHNRYLCWLGLTESELRLGDALYELYESSPDEGHLGDMALIDKWAEEIGIREWYEWVELKTQKQGA